jgi:hypothetical protein
MERELENEGDDAEDEPSLGSFDQMTDQSKAWSHRAGDVWNEVDLEEDDAEAEPSLAASGIPIISSKCDGPPAIAAI